jgi:hypothetical protein
VKMSIRARLNCVKMSIRARLNYVERGVSEPVIARDHVNESTKLLRNIENIFIEILYCNLIILNTSGDVVH